MKLALSGFSGWVGLSFFTKGELDKGTIPDFRLTKSEMLQGYEIRMTLVAGEYQVKRIPIFF